MRTYARSLIFVAVLAGTTAAAQSLGELAQKEKERREQVKSNPRPITNTDTAKYQNSSVSTGGISAPAPKEGGDGKTPADKKAAAPGSSPAADESVDLEGRTESFWRQTFADARSRLREMENDSKVLQLKVNDLQNRFFRENDGFQQQELQRQINKTIYEQEVTRDGLAKAQKQLEELERDARKSGALPGWIEGKPQN